MVLLVGEGFESKSASDVLFPAFGYLTFQEQRVESGKWWLSALGSGAFGSIHASAQGEPTHGICCSFGIFLFFFEGLSGGGGGVGGVCIISAVALIVCMPMGRAAKRARRFLPFWDVPFF